jgi:hypothetical protein
MYLGAEMPPLRGRTTRTILRALIALSEGWDCVVIAHPAAEAYRIADEIAHYACEMDIPFELRDDNALDRSEDDVPLILTRPFGWEAIGVRRSERLPKVFVVDHSAVHERTLTPATRSVLPLEL